jgi:hypothetical protein
VCLGIAYGKSLELGKIDVILEQNVSSFLESVSLYSSWDRGRPYHYGLTFAKLYGGMITSCVVRLRAGVYMRFKSRIQPHLKIF